MGIAAEGTDLTECCASSTILISPEFDNTPKQPRLEPEKRRLQIEVVDEVSLLSIAGLISSTAPPRPPSEGVAGLALAANLRSQTLTVGSPAGPAEMK